jgi:ABC-type nitrate/sulfonate/bicarbonate transport system substrate-binding protein
MVGKANGWFDKAMGSQVKIDWKSFNAGPSAIEALFAGAIDMTYVGPNPAINGYVRSNGEALRIVAGGDQRGSGTGGAERLGHSEAAGFSWASESRRRRWAKHARRSVAGVVEIERVEDQ